jgi:hypothetical protein
MATQKRDVQKLDVQPLDMIRSAIALGLKKLSIRKRTIKMNFWTGSFTADETVTTVEPNDDRK